MKRRTFLALTAGSFLPAPRAALAQPAGKTYRVGIVHLGGPYAAMINGLRGCLKEELVSYGVSFHAVGRQCAKYVHRVLSGTSPADLPVERADRFELAINLKTAKALGLTIPHSLLGRADEVVQ